MTFLDRRVDKDWEAARQYNFPILFLLNTL